MLGKSESRLSKQGIKAVTFHEERIFQEEDFAPETRDKVERKVVRIKLRMREMDERYESRYYRKLFSYSIFLPLNLTFTFESIDC